MATEIPQTLTNNPQKTLVSIIMPVYGVERFIGRALDSVIHQTYKNIELIVVNDATPDNSMDIVNQISDSRIRIINHSNNQGLSKSRNDGIDLAKGDYIAFLDSDDYLDTNFIEELLDAAQKTNADIAMANTKLIHKDKIHILENTNQIIIDYFEKIQSLPNGTSCNKIYRKELIKNYGIKFPTGRYWEDNIFTIQACFFSNHLACINTTNYNYCIRKNSITSSIDKIEKLKSDSLSIAEEILNFNNDKALSTKDKNVIYDFIVSNFIHTDYLNDINYRKKLRFLLERNGYITKQFVDHLMLNRLKCMAFHLLSLLHIKYFKKKYKRSKTLIKINSN